MCFTLVVEVGVTLGCEVSAVAGPTQPYDYDRVKYLQQLMGLLASVRMRADRS